MTTHHITAIGTPNPMMPYVTTNFALLVALIMTSF